ncbi:MAG: hypothetical protein IRZ04_21165 [Rhodospirillales bacterium]|nr:hypothetical protein [Rhodospirillales bacterium]
MMVQFGDHACEALGAKRLAELLIGIAEYDAAAKRRLRLELTARAAPESVAAEARKRLGQIARAPSFVDWRKVRDLVPLSERSAA